MSEDKSIPQLDDCPYCHGWVLLESVPIRHGEPSLGKGKHKHTTLINYINTTRQVYVNGTLTDNLVALPTRKDTR